MPQPILQTRDLCKSYFLGKEEIPVLKNINISMQKGDYTAIMGPSGSGKSTLLNILGCLDKPGSGDYLLAGQSVKSHSQEALAGIRNHQIGFVFQNFNLLPKLTLWSNVELPLIYGNVPKKKKMQLIKTALTRLGLWERRFHRPNEISGGQKQRAAIARALVKNPSIILADEPTGNLDSTTTGEILDLFKQLNREGNTILVITHEREVAAAAGNNLTLKDGMLYDGV